MRRLICALLAVSFYAGAPAYARMYQWVESGSGIVRLSGDPPPWYRNGGQGPRTLVFEDGRLIDDTAIELPPEQEEALRKAAFREVDLKREEVAIKKLERAALRESRLQKQPGDAQPESRTSGIPGKAAPDLPTDDMVTAEDLDATTVEQMKGLIREWDKRHKGTPGSP